MSKFKIIAAILGTITAVLTINALINRKKHKEDYELADDTDLDEYEDKSNAERFNDPNASDVEIHCDGCEYYEACDKDTKDCVKANTFITEEGNEEPVANSEDSDDAT